MPKMTELPPIGDWIDAAPWRTRSVSFLLITDTSALEAHDLPDKRRMLTDLPGMRVAVWHGKHYSTSRRIATADDLLAVLEKIS